VAELLANRAQPALQLGDPQGAGARGVDRDLARRRRLGDLPLLQLELDLGLLELAANAALPLLDAGESRLQLRDLAADRLQLFLARRLLGRERQRGEQQPDSEP
jgi:hypothetical protein